MDKRICPVCKKEYIGYPAISRRDNETEICSKCGVDEALNDFISNYKDRGAGNDR